ncbi:response regulator [Dethiosulfatarculus sandiegensis]|uniref:Chemotaxis protein CheY n=1 Tax=Dethiosulfatarculus sandiegensis TaxID=1429043 RepID=A0A0D2J4S7_9BACT|nr:response regulator [Dethiosulfatarculus sandiegensis]KIX13134.1 chemotaxis protein CheY [Dethiosulfatarculus sandiegensis]
MTIAQILVVDDEQEFLENVSERLRNRDIEVDTALNGEEALEKIKDNIYDAIVMDLMMPGLDGLETLKQALQRKPDLQIILLTGQATVKKGVEAMRQGAFDFLEKPADLDLLVEKVKEGRAKRIKLDEKAREEEVKDLLKRIGW